MNDEPTIGIAVWLLKGPLPNRVRWAIDNGFTGVSLLQNVMDIEPAECREAASIIRDAGLNVTYHGNFGHKLLPGNRLDRDFIASMMENILWWDEHTDGVASACFDSVNPTDAEGQDTFLLDVNVEAAFMFHESLKGTNIRMGIENCFGTARFRSIADIDRFGNECASLSPGMLFDLGHANIYVRSDANGETTLGEYIAAIPLEILEVHVSDNMGERDEHRHLGYGNADMDQAVRALSRRNYTSQITVEVCVDIQAGLYGAHLDNPEELQPLLITRDAIAKSWARNQ